MSTTANVGDFGLAYAILITLRSAFMVTFLIARFTGLMGGPDITQTQTLHHSQLCQSP